MEEKITCKQCGYKWSTRSNLLYVSCPSCLQKVRNERRLKEVYDGNKKPKASRVVK